MKRPAKILQLWRNLTRDGNAYNPPNRTRDADFKRAIPKKLDKLRLWAKPDLTEQTQEGQAFLALRDRIAIQMRNYCRSIKHIDNKHYLKRAKALTVLVMNLQLNQLDEEEGLGSIEGLDHHDVSHLDHHLEQGDEREQEENEEDDRLMGLPTGGLPPQMPPRHLVPPPRKEPDPPPPVPGLSWARIDARLQQLVQQYNALRAYPPTQAKLQRLFALSAATRTRDGVTPEQVNAILDQFDAALQSTHERVHREREQQQGRIEHSRERIDKLKAFARPGRDFFTSGMSAKLSTQNLKAGKQFKAFQAALEAAEQMASDANLTALEKTARDYLAHYVNDLSDREKNSKESLLKKHVCEQALKAIPLERCLTDLQILGPPEHWNLREENKAATIYAKLLFEAGDSTAPVLTGSANGCWWVEKAMTDEPKKKFLFKPITTESDVNGFPIGGGVIREVLGKTVSDKLQVITGLDLRCPETTLVKINKSKLNRYDDLVDQRRDSEGSEVLGSMQHFTKNEGKLVDLLEPPDDQMDEQTANQRRQQITELGQSISPQECQKMAILDLLTLNMDRHGGNFLVGERDDGTGNRVRALLPIDHGMILPTRSGLIARTGSMGALNAGLSLLPGSNEPFTPEMLAKVDAIDPEEVVQAMRDAHAQLVQQYPDLAQQAGVTEENYALVKRSCQFLKKAAREGLTVNQIHDAYFRSMPQILDAPEDGLDQAFNQVIDKERREWPERQRVLTEVPRLQDCLPVNRELKNLGWDILVPHSAYSANTGYRFLLRNPRLIDCFQSRIPNPQVQQDIDRLVAKINGLGRVIPEMAPGASPGMRIAALQEALEQALQNKVPEGDRLALGGIRGEEMREVLMDYLQEHGTDPIQGNLQTTLDAFMNESITRWTQEGLVASYLEAYHGKPLPAPLTWKYLDLRAWAELREMGGIGAFERGDTEREDIERPYTQLNALRKEQKLRAALEQVVPPPRDLPPPPNPQQLEQEIRDLSQEVGKQPVLQQRRHSQRLSQALRLSQGGKIEESQKLIQEVKQDLRSSQR